MFVYGKNVAKETLRSNKAVKKAYLSKEFNDKEIISLLEKKNVNVEYLSKNEIMKMDKNNNQGIILSVPDFEYCSLSSIIDCEKPFIVILDHLEDPHNFGAIIRTCEAAGVTGIIIPKDRSVDVNATVMKTSAGALNNMKICKVTNLNRAIDELKENGIWIIGTDMDNLQRGIYNVEGFGECRMNVNPQNQAFILIQTEDGCYIFSADKDEKTSEVYQQLKDDL